MKKTLIIVLTVLLSFAAVSCNKTEESKPVEVKDITNLETLAQQYYEIVGYNYAQMFTYSYEDFDPLAFAQGFIDFYYGNERFTAEQQQEIYGTYAFGENLAAAEEFLAQNKSNADVQETKSGLQYRVDVQGNGDKPSATSTVNVDYKLSLIDGTEVEQSAGVSFPLNGVIAGFSEGLQLMNVGSTYTFWIHPDLGYGATGNSAIEGNTLLIFTVTLNSIN